MLNDQLDMQYHLNNIHMLSVDNHLYHVDMNTHKFLSNVVLMSTRLSHYYQVYQDRLVLIEFDVVLSLSAEQNNNHQQAVVVHRHHRYHFRLLSMMMMVVVGVYVHVV